MISGTDFGRTINTSYFTLSGGTGWDYGASVSMYGKDSTINAGVCLIRSNDGTNDTILSIQPSGTISKTTNSTTKNVAMQEDVVPRSGGAVMTGDKLARTIDTDALYIYGGSGWQKGGTIMVKGQSSSVEGGLVELYPATSSQQKSMKLYPSGTWTWGGTACQITSDQRLKQQITEIDDKLLDAWKDVAPVQFKYNDSVNEKGDNARLHTGYVVQQIAEACQNHDVDIDNYGLYCHEVYPEKTEEVTITNEDGTTSKETKVIEEASEHYSLRYTEALIVECAFLRREVERLTERVTKLESRKKKTTS